MAQHTIFTWETNGAYDFSTHGSKTYTGSFYGFPSGNIKILGYTCYVNCKGMRNGQPSTNGNISVSFGGLTFDTSLSNNKFQNIPIYSSSSQTFSSSFVTISGDCSIQRSSDASSSNTIVVQYENLQPTSCTAPTSVYLALSSTATEGTLYQPMKASATYYLKWSGASGGTNNPIQYYQIQYSADNSSWLGTLTSTSQFLELTGEYLPTAKGQERYYRVITCGSQSGYNSTGSTITVCLSRNLTPTAINLRGHTEQNSIDSTALYVNKGYNNYTFSWTGGSLDGCEISKYLFNINNSSSEELTTTSKIYTVAIEEDTFFTVQSVLDDIDNTVSEPSLPVYIHPVSISRNPVITLTNQVGTWNNISPVVKETADFSWSEPTIINKEGLIDTIKYTINGAETTTTTTKTIVQDNGTSLSFSIKATVQTPYGLEVESSAITYPTIYYAALFNVEGLITQGTTSGYTVKNRVISWTYTPHNYGGNIKRVVVQKEDNSTYQIFTELIDNSCVIDFSALSGGETISIKIQFVDEYGYSTTTDVFTITRLEAPTITINTVSVNGQPTTNAQVSITVKKPASIAAWSDIGYNFGIRHQNVEKILLSSTDTGFQIPIDIGDSANATYVINLAFTNIKSITNISDAILKNNYGKIDTILFAKAYDKNYVEETKSESNKTITLDYRGTISPPAITKNATLSSPGYPTSLSDIVLNLQKGVYKNIEGTTQNGIDVVLVQDGVTLTSSDVSSYSLTLPIFSSDTTQTYTYTNTHVYKDGSKISSSTNFQLECKRWTAPSCSIPLLILQEDETGLATVRVENFNTSIDCKSSATPHFTTKIEIMDSNGAILINKTYDVIDTYQAQSFENLSITNYKTDKIIQVRITIIATNGKALTYLFPQMILRAAGVPFAIRKGGIGVNIGQSEDITTSDTPIKVIGNNSIATILSLAANNTSQAQIELIKDTQKMILCFDSETGNFEIKFE